MVGLEGVTRFFRDLARKPDEATYRNFHLALDTLNLRLETHVKAQLLEATNWYYDHLLPGENGSARLLVATNNPDLKAVVKTYDPIFDFLENSVAYFDRVAEIGQELNCFLVAETTGLVNIPTTTVKNVNNSILDSWHMPYVIDSDQPNERVVMLQEFIPHAQEFFKLNTRLPDIAGPDAIFGLLAFDYLIAYGDGRGRNLLVDPDNKLWAIDHGGSFRLDGSIRNAENLGIPNDYLLPDTHKLQSALREEHFNALQPVLKGFLTPQQVARFGVRFHKLQHYVRSVDHCTVEELKTAMNPAA